MGRRVLFAPHPQNFSAASGDEKINLYINAIRGEMRLLVTPKPPLLTQPFRSANRAYCRRRRARLWTEEESYRERTRIDSDVGPADFRRQCEVKRGAWELLPLGESETC